MFLFLMVLVLIIYYLFSDAVPAYKKSDMKVFWLYICLMGFALLLNLYILLDFQLPIISEAIKGFLSKFINFNY